MSIILIVYLSVSVSVFCMELSAPCGPGPRLLDSSTLPRKQHQVVGKHENDE